MNKKIIVILVIGLVLLTAFSGCTLPSNQKGSEGTPTPAMANSSEIPMPQEGEETEESAPELPF